MTPLHPARIFGRVPVGGVQTNTSWRTVELYATAQDQEIGENMKKVAEETQSNSLANFLGDMWKEMRTFATPFYKEHLEESLEDLVEERPKLEKELESAQKRVAEHKSKSQN